MPQVFADGARVELDTSITAEDVSLNVIQGGELFPIADYAGVGILPQISPENWFKLVIQDDDGFEVVYCYSHSVGSNTFSNLRRGMDGTTARAFSTGAVVGLRPLAKDMGDLVSRAKTNTDLLETKADKTGNIEGNAATATKLESARALSISGGVTAAAKNFDGSLPVDLEVTAIDVSKANAGTLPVARGGTSTTTSTGSGNVVLSNSPALGGTPTAPTAATATNTTQIATTAFVQAVNSSDTGSAATAVALKTARTINGVSFNGTANITINAVDATSRVASSEKGVANGVATLDSAGKVPTTQLPSYVDDVLEFANLAGFPATGETGKIYIALDTNKTYRWSGSAYVYITSGAVDSVAGKTGVVTLVKADVGLSNVDNTADSAKPVSTAQQAALDSKVDKVANQRLMTAAEATKLANIAEQATKNASDAALRDRSTHTGTQSISTVEGLADTLATKLNYDQGAAFVSINNAEQPSQGGLRLFQADGRTDIMPDSNWWSLIRVQHPGYPDGYWQDLALPFVEGGRPRVRHNVAGTKSQWKELAYYSDVASTTAFTSVPSTFQAWEIVVTHPHIRKMVWSSASNKYVRAPWHAPGKLSHFLREVPVGHIEVRSDVVLNTADFPDLAAYLGVTGPTFVLDETRGEFLRALDSGRGADPGRSTGSWQDSDNKSHTHTGSADSAGDHTHTVSGTTNTAGAHSHGFTMAGSTGANERPLGGRATGNWFTVAADGAHQHSVSGTADSAGSHTHTVTINAAGGSEARPRNVAYRLAVQY